MDNCNRKNKRKRNKTKEKDAVKAKKKRIHPYDSIPSLIMHLLILRRERID